MPLFSGFQRFSASLRRGISFGLLLAPAWGFAAPLKLAVFSTVLTEFAVRVGGPDAEVSSLIPPGVDPHTFEPSPRDLAKVQSADLVLLAGIDFDSGLARSIAHASAGPAVINLSSDPDPHWWNSVAATEQVVRRLTAELDRARPTAAGRFDQRSQAVLADLDQLNRAIRQQLATIPPDQRVLVTTHDAFAWFARDYGFKVRPLTGINPEAEPNARDLARLIDTIRGTHIKAVFFESAASPRLVTALAEETGARVGGALYADGLSPDGAGTTYAGMIHHNVSTLVDGLK